MFKTWRDYFSFSYLFEEHLDHSKTYIFVEFPHGVGGGALTAERFPKDAEAYHGVDREDKGSVSDRGGKRPVFHPAGSFIRIVCLASASPVIAS